MSKSYVTKDGNYGQDKCLVFDTKKLTETQYDNISYMPDDTRYAYVHAILHGNTSIVRFLEKEYIGEL